MGKILGAIILLVALIWFIPWIGIGSINRLFDIGIEHSAANYLYVWVLMLLTGGFNPFAMMDDE